MKSVHDASQGIPPELEEFVAQAIVEPLRQSRRARGVRNSNVPIVAHVAATTSARQTPPLRVWRYYRRRLVETGPDALERALGKDRTQWPSSTFLFSIAMVSSDRAMVRVDTLHDMGLAEWSRGGHSERWELEKHADGWTVLKHRVDRCWD